MGFPDTACIAFRLQTAVYRPLFKEVWGAGSLDIRFPHDTEEICETPGGAATFGGSVTPIRLSPEDRTKADSVYDNWGQSISFFESSNDVSPFTSKVDASLSTAPAYTFTATEAAGRTPVRRQGQLQFLPTQSLRRGAKRLRGVKMQLKRLVALVLSMLMMLAVVGCYGQPLSTREKGTLLGGGAGAGQEH
jgi:hypothetical protein